MMGNNALLKEQRETPVDFLEEIGATTAPEFVEEDTVVKLMGETEGLSPNQTEQENNPKNDDPEEEQENDPENDDPEEEQENDPENDDLEEEQENDPENEIDPEEPTEVEAENFFTAEQAIGLIDNGIVELENAIFKLADVEVNKKQLHYTAKQKKLLEKPLAKVFKKHKFKVNNPVAGFFMTFVGLEFAKITGILANKEIDKKHQQQLEEKDQQLAQMQWQMHQMQMQLQQFQQMHRQQPQRVQHSPQHPEQEQYQEQNGRNEKGQFTSTSPAPKRKKGALTRKPGETRGRKPKNTIELKSAVNG